MCNEIVLNAQNNIADSLVKYYYLSTNYIDNPTYKEKFFDYFPNDFNTFINVYGYKEIINDKKEHDVLFSPLYDFSFSHIDFFYSLDKLIDTLKFCKKIISVSLNGFWESDGVSIFQKFFQTKLFNNIDINLYILNTLSAKECLSVYYFLFDGPHPDNYKEKYERLYHQILLKDKKQAQLLKRSYKKLLKENHCHGH
ncbi:MAG: hypothetical protein LBR17_01155 [Bacteroidales bacterium]|nr:hypothetical protein [Bacteroidales bacterium]